ncbi:hypothetical protein CFB3_28160 [Clostridium folliculivorans]|uniref:Uncharacterized protein n=1 Tax=Clostridium folliculivorans TaxID=2886038 RepID=A0A9W5Y111_9CLOT|nr:hypothetical protein CFOLD11_14370 [Clostridium folliculivorans]GKU30709.1 hypothetical protein CFB3_28160 [Clostridium folliculivorans]
MEIHKMLTKSLKFNTIVEKFSSRYNRKIKRSIYQLPSFPMYILGKADSQKKLTEEGGFGSFFTDY